MMKIALRQTLTGAILFEHTCKSNTIRRTLELAIQQRVPLSSVDLSGADLRGFDFRGQNLQLACFDGAMLDRALFANCNMRKASFVRATLTYANLSCVTADSCDFSGAEMTLVDFSSADLRKADFSEAKVPNAIFRAADLRGASFYKADCCEAQMLHTDIESVNLVGAKLAGMRFGHKKVIAGNALLMISLMGDATRMLLSFVTDQGIYLRGKGIDGFFDTQAGKLFKMMPKPVAQNCVDLIQAHAKDCYDKIAASN